MSKETQQLDQYIQSTYLDLNKLHEYAIEDYKVARLLNINEGDIEEQKIKSTITTDKLKAISDAIKQRTELIKIVERKVKTIDVPLDDQKTPSTIGLSDEDRKNINAIFKKNQTEETYTLKD